MAEQGDWFARGDQGAAGSHRRDARHPRLPVQRRIFELTEYQEVENWTIR